MYEKFSVHAVRDTHDMGRQISYSVLMMAQIERQNLHYIAAKSCLFSLVDCKLDG